jgi:hypothetical protein
MAEEITFVGPTAASKKLDKLLARPGMAKRVAEIREQMATVDRAYADSLRTRWVSRNQRSAGSRSATTCCSPP